MSPTRYLIIGGSAAGMAAAQAIREQDPLGEIQVLSAEADLPYFRPLIPFVVAEEKAEEELALMGQGPYAATDIEVQLDGGGVIQRGYHRIRIHHGPVADLAYSQKSGKRGPDGVIAQARLQKGYFGLCNLKQALLFVQS